MDLPIIAANFTIYKNQTPYSNSAGWMKTVFPELHA
jgi:hypothetical protein